jgi:excisionase family DNA binding protein
LGLEPAIVPPEMGSDLEEFLRDLPTATSEVLLRCRLQCGMGKGRFADLIAELSGHPLFHHRYLKFEDGEIEPRGYVVVAAIKAVYLFGDLQGPVESFQDKVAGFQRQIETLIERRKQASTMPPDWAIHLKPEDSPPEDVITIVEASKRFGLSRPTIYKWGREHKLRGYLWKGSTYISVEQMTDLARGVGFPRKPRRRRRIAKTSVKG